MIFAQSSPLPLVQACKHEHKEMVRMLFDKGVEPHPLAMVEAIKGRSRYHYKVNGLIEVASCYASELLCMHVLNLPHWKEI